MARRPHRKGSVVASGSVTSGPSTVPAEVLPTDYDDGGEPLSNEGQSLARRCPLRRCIVTQTVQPDAQMVRCVLSPDGIVVPDLERKLPGRGLWLSARRDVVEQAVAKKAFARAARRAVTVPDHLADHIGELFRRRCLYRLGLARRAGIVIAGYDKVRGAAKGGQVAVLLNAIDSSPDGRRKLAALLPSKPVIEIFTSAELAEVLGRDHIVHVAVLTGSPTQGGMATSLTDAIERLIAYAPLLEPVGEHADETAPPETGS